MADVEIPPEAAEQPSGRELARRAEQAAGYWDDTVRELETERNEACAEVKRLRAELEELRAGADPTPTAPGQPITPARWTHLFLNADAEFRHLVARQAVEDHAERNRLTEQVKVLAAVLPGADPLCPDHADYETDGCPCCSHATAVRTARAALDGEDLVDEITPRIAAHVLFHFDAGGYEAGSFTKDLILLLTRADPVNRRQLTASFPAYGTAVQIAQDTTDGIAHLTAIANQREKGSADG